MIEYPYLPNGRQILYVSADNQFMVEAKKVCMEMSADDKQPSGAVIVRDQTIIGRGALKGLISNKKFQRLHETYCPRKLLKVKSGTKYWMCPGCGRYR